MRLLGALLLSALCMGAAARPAPAADWEVHVSSNRVSSLCPVPGGVWWGSTGGVVFLGGGGAGYTKVVRSEDGLKSNDVTAVAVDASGAVWLGTAGHGACILGPGPGWRFVNTQTLALLSDQVLDIFAWDNMVAVGTAGGVTLLEDGVFRRFFNGVDWGLSGCDSAIAVCGDSSSMFVGTQCGMYAYDLDSGRWRTVIPEKRVHDIDFDGDSLFWAVSGDSIFTYDGGRLDLVPKALLGNDALKAVAALDTTVWVVTRSGPARFDAANARWVYNRSGIPQDLWDGTAAAIASGGAVYMGTRRGAARLAGDTWEILEAPGPYGNYIHDLALDGKGRVWCTTGFRFGGAPDDANRGVYVYDGSDWEQLDRPVIPSSISYPVCASPYDGSMWLGFWDAANGDLLRYSMADTGFTSFRGVLDSRVVSDIHVAGGGEVLFTQYTGSTSFGVLYNFQASVVYYGTYDPVPCTSSPFLLAIGSGTPGCYLLGDYNSTSEGSPPEIAEFCPGLSWSSRNDDECTQWSPTSGWPQGHVYALTTDPYGVMWCGTSSGLGSYDGAWHTVSNRIGVVWDVEVDANGTKWVAADLGLYEFQGQGVLWNDFEGRINVYDSSNSLLPPRPVKAVDVDADGSIWIGTAGGGVYRFRPEPPPAKLSAWVQAYPNPFNAFKQDYDRAVRFEGYREGSTVRIFTLDGSLVAEMDAGGEWDGTNDKGEEVASGVYIFHTHAEDGSEFLGRIVVIR